MTFLEVMGFVTGVVIAVSTTVTAVVVVRRGRRSETIPHYSVLHASLLDDSDPKHGVQLILGWVGNAQYVQAGKVINLTRTTVTLHNGGRRRTIDLSAIQGANRYDADWGEGTA